MRSSRIWSGLFCAAAVALGGASTARAGGYDVPRLYGARYAGMGAAGVGAADDSLAIYFNPAGLAGIDVASIELDGVYLTGFMEAAPTATSGVVRSERTHAPFFFAGGGARLAPWIVGGFALYPVAASGAAYRYESGTGPVRDEYGLILMEFAPAVAIELPEQHLSIGASYRMTVARVPIEQGPVDGAPTTDVRLAGSDFAAFRVGLMWRPIEALSVGLAFRSKVSLDASAEDGRAYGLTLSPSSRLTSGLTFPARLSAGVRYDVSTYGISLDFHYLLNRVNSVEQAEIGPLTLDVINDWQDSVELHLGGEGVWLDGRLPVRIGYILDTQVTSPNYPTAFGSPPGAGHTGTVGTGWNEPRWHVDLAYSAGGARGTITAEDLMGQDLGPCSLCGGPGRYRAVIHGIHLGGGYRFD